MYSPFESLFGIEYSAGEDAFLTKAAVIAAEYLRRPDVTVSELVTLSLIVSEMSEFVEKHYTYGGDANGVQ